MPRLRRRVFLGRIGAAAGGGALAIIVGARPLAAQPDSDAREQRPDGLGRANACSGDYDAGAVADATSRPRGAPVNCTEPFQTGFVDSDAGVWADPAGNGRGPARPAMTGFTDRDEGATADRVEHGRGRPIGMIPSTGVE